jgi:hypothetical protein
MSSSAMARRKRAAAPPPPQPQGTRQNNYASSSPAAYDRQPQTRDLQSEMTSNKPMSIQQILSIIDSRIRTLEEFRQTFADEKFAAPTNTSTNVDIDIDSILQQVKQAEMSAVKTIENASNKSIVEIQSATDMAQMETLQSESVPEMVSSTLEESVTQEYETRFTMIVTEINELKDMLLKVQSFTMEVNKSLMEERLEMMKSVQGIMENNIEESNTMITGSEDEAFTESQRCDEVKSTLETVMETLAEEETIVVESDQDQEQPLVSELESESELEQNVTFT